MAKTKRCVLICLHDDYWFLGPAIKAASSFGPVFAAISKVPWNGQAGDWERAAKIANEAGAEVILGDWPDESAHRQSALATVKEKGFRFALIPDGDEILEASLLETLGHVADTGMAERVYAHMDTYWKSGRYVIRPRETLTPAILLDLTQTQHIYIRDYRGGKALVLGPEFGVIHHLSYAGPDERILRKISSWSHRHEVVGDWYRDVWLAWDRNPMMRDLHPTHPPAYGMVERIALPEALTGIWDERPVAPTHPERPAKWPKVSVVIPLHGGPEELRQCLESLAKCVDLIHETIVVDDVSPDDAPAVAEEFGVRLLRNESNLGFGGTCNAGFDASTGDVILFLNSDTIVPRSGFLRLIEGLTESGSIAAAGPMSNNVGYHQRVSPTYTSLDTIDEFASDLAATFREDRDVEILVGFALAVKRSVLEEVGLFDERFGRGLFEDTDLCYRISRAGYRLSMATGAYVHHWGSRTLSRVIPDTQELLGRNGGIYREKWRLDLECGFASHLPGFDLNSGLVRFDKARRPDRLLAGFRQLAAQARVSLCMIVRDEERVISQCLESAKPFFHEIIVVDTGSTDRTKEMVLEHGAKLFEIPWPDSFSAARNESLKHATGEWIFWLDADDVLPVSTGEQILNAAMTSPKDVTAYVVPVQFVEDGPNAGTRVDHVKLIRNFPGIEFELRIHEQILPSIRAYGGQLGRLYGVVLHAGYDTSEKGQAKKRDRDWYLLSLDLNERPNHPFVLFNVGMTHHYSGEHEDAIKALEASIRHSGENDSHLRKAYALMGVSHRELGRLDQAEETFRKGLTQVGADVELTFHLAMTAASKGQFLEARLMYERMPSEVGDYFSSVDIGILTFKRLHNLASVRFAMGDYLGARRDWEEAFAANPGFVASLLALFDAALEFGDFATARACLDRLADREGLSTDWAERGAKLSEAAREEGGAVGFLARHVNAYPRAVGPRLVFVRRLLAAQRVEEATPHLHELNAGGVAEAAFYLGVSALQAGDIGAAITWNERAVQLNPEHRQSTEQLARLRAAHDVPSPSILSESEQRKLLIGPRAGTLGPATKRCSVVIVTFNSEDYIGPCLESVMPTLIGEDEVIVVDNASKDKSGDVAESFGVQVIRNDSNIGYAPAANVGALQAKGEFVVFINPDTTVTPGWLDALLAKVVPGVGAVGPVSDNVGGDQFVRNYLHHDLRKETVAREMSEKYLGKSRETRLLMGMCVLVPRAALDVVGLFDEALFLGADDLEFSWRLRILGFRLLVALDSLVHHVGGRSFATVDSGDSAKLIADSDRFLLAKLIRFYGPDIPSSYQLWGCDILQSVLQ